MIDGDSSPFCSFVHAPKLSAVSLSNKTFKWLWVNVIRLKDLRQIEWTKTLVIVLPFAPIVPILRSESLPNISHTVWPSFTLTGAVLLSPFTFTGFITAYKDSQQNSLWCQLDSGFLVGGLCARRWSGWKDSGPCNGGPKARQALGGRMLWC